MKQTDYFEGFNPPALNEAMLRRELERREARRRTVLLALAGAMLQIAAVLFAVLARRQYPLLSLAVVCLAILSTAAGVAAVIVYAQRGGIGGVCVEV